MTGGERAIPADDKPADAAPPILSYSRADASRRVKVVPVLLPVLSILLSLLSFPAGVVTTMLMNEHMSVAWREADRAGFAIFAALSAAACGIGAATWARFRRPCTPTERRALRLSRAAAVIGATACFVAVLILLAGGVR